MLLSFLDVKFNSTKGRGFRLLWILSRYFIAWQSHPSDINLNIATSFIEEIVAIESNSVNRMRSTCLSYRMQLSSHTNDDELQNFSQKGLNMA